MSINRQALQKPCREVIGISVPPNIALTSFSASVKLINLRGKRATCEWFCIISSYQASQNAHAGPKGNQFAINETVVVVSFTATWQRGALLLQIAQAISVLAIDDARAPGGPATCGRKGKGYVGQYMESDLRRCPRCRPVPGHQGIHTSGWVLIGFLKSTMAEESARVDALMIRSGNTIATPQFTSCT